MGGAVFIWVVDLMRCHLHFMCVAECEPACQHQGVCTVPGVCQCIPGWTGSRCQEGIFSLVLYVMLYCKPHSQLGCCVKVEKIAWYTLFTHA